MSSRAFERARLKKEYKKIMKNIPKSKRLPFSAVYKQIKEDKRAQKLTSQVASTETFEELDDIFIDVEDESSKQDTDEG